MLVDSHCHLNYLDEPDARLDAARAAGVGAFVCIGVDEAGLDEVLGLAQRHADVWASVGVHPGAAADHAELGWITERAAHPRVVAIGETGLDFYRLEQDDETSRAVQRAVFDQQLGIAAAMGLPVVVHTRAAEDDTRALLNSNTGVSGVLHCFTESWSLAEAALELGFYISISGIVTFRNADNVRDVARRVPADRLLIETDAPWLAPVPHRGEQNHPALLEHTAAFLAELRGVTREELAATTTENFFALFTRAQRSALPQAPKSSSHS